jgi:hypothetical protein
MGKFYSQVNFCENPILPLTNAYHLLYEIDC